MLFRSKPMALTAQDAGARAALKVAFAGTPEFAAVALDAILKAGYTVPLVLTQPDRPAGRGMKLQASAVKQVALAHDDLAHLVHQGGDEPAAFFDECVSCGVFGHAASNLRIWAGRWPAGSVPRVFIVAVCTQVITDGGRWALPLGLAPQGLR